MDELLSAFAAKYSAANSRSLFFGARLKASQRGRSTVAPVRVARVWTAGDPVRWKDRAGAFKRDTGDGEHSEIAIGERVYRVRTEEIG